MSTFGYKARRIIINFLLWSIYLSSSLVKSKKGPEYLTRTTQLFLPLIIFLLLFFFLKFSYSSEAVFSNYFHLCLIVSASLVSIVPCFFPD